MKFGASTNRLLTHAPVGGGAAYMTTFLVLVAGPFAGADEIKIGPYWYKDVAISDVRDGQVTHVNAAGTEITTELKRVRGLKVTAYPQLAEAQEALDRRDDKAALAWLAKVDRQVRELWLRHWVWYQQMRIAARLGDPLTTVNQLVQLARGKADAFYFSDPPVQVLDQADTALLRELRSRLATAMRGTKGKVPEAGSIRTMLDAVSARSEKLTRAIAGPVDPGPDAAAMGQSSPSPPTGSALAFSRALDENDPIARLLRRGQYQAALRDVNKLLRSSSRFLARRLYMRGMAQLGRAEQSGDLGRYKSAGLDFMRVIAHFPRNTTYGSAALLEIGYVHLKIGRDDLARKLLNKVRIDDRDDPELSARLEELLGLAGP